MRNGLAIFAATAFIALSSQAHAGYTYTSYSVFNEQNVHVGAGGGLTSPEYVGAGEITLLGGSLDNINVWCSDLFDMLQAPGSFTTLAALSGPVADKLNALISNGDKLLSTNYDASAALQVAIWNTLFSNIIVADNTYVNTLAETMLMEVQTGAWKADPNERVMQLSNEGNQSQIYLDPIPEPATLAVLGFGLFALVAMRRGWGSSGLSALSA